MSTQAPLWAFMAEAIDGVGDAHLPPGVHVRALPSTKLGVPATPLVVTRAVLTAAQLKEFGRTDGVIWIDSHGATRTLPFDVTPDNPVYGYFPVPNVILAELSAAAAGAAPTTAQPVVTAPLAVRDISPLLHPAQPIATAPMARAGVNLNQLRDVLEASASAVAAAAARGFIRFEALANSGLGLAPFQSRQLPPYALAAWPIPLVRVVGRGNVRGIRWLDVTRIRQWRETFWELWSLPVPAPTPRYTPTPTAPSEAKDRVTRAGVRHQPMYVAYTAALPAAAPPTAPGDALARLDQVRPDIDRWLDKLLHDLTHPPAEVTDSQPISGSNGSVAVPIEPFLIAGAIDPDVGHYLGFGDNDQKPPAPAGSLVFYRVRGLWRWNPKRWTKGEAPAFASALRATVDDAVNQFEELKKYDIAPREKGPFVDLYATAVALIGTPPSPPGPISFDAAEDRGWLATPPPPNVRRALRLLASGFLPHPVAALAATDASGDRTLHPFPHTGRIILGQPLPHGTPLPIVVSRPNDAVSPGQGRFEDRDAPEGAVLYRLTQGDWFGRWGPWRTRNAPAKTPTPPMRPTIELYPQPLAFGTPIPAGTLSGMIEVRIPIPRTEDLPAGGAALARLDLDETFAGSPTSTTSYTLAALAGATIETHPAPAHDLLVIKRTGPALLPSASRKATYTARWIDVLTHVSPNADPAARTIVDPRPPSPPPVITELRYTARPDAQGHARVDLDFASTPGTRYRVFASTETTLLKALDSTGHTTEANDIRGAAPGAPRAMKFKAYKSLFGWDHFECLTKQSILATDTTTHFTHRVSGSLDVLAIYRVIGEGTSGALSDLTEADLVPFAVPNLGGPPRPQVAVLNAGLDPTTQGARLRVKVPIGKATPKAWRLRRASVPVNDPLRMNLVARGTVSGATVEREGTSFEIDATEPLKPWRRYRFAVDVQAADPPGAPTVGTILPGEWSEPSAPATLAVIPPTAPAPPTTVQIANVGSVLQITVTHPHADSLASTAMGPHRFELWRVEPGARPSRREVLFTRGAGNTWVGKDAGVAPAGTYATTRVIDPIGRRSDATISNQI
jgi:hypothetical protein